MMCASFVCDLSVIDIVFVHTYSRMNFASSSITKCHVLVVHVIVGMRITSHIRVDDLSTICD